MIVNVIDPDEVIEAAISRARILAMLNPEPNKQGEHQAVDEFLAPVAAAVDVAQAAYDAERSRDSFRKLRRLRALQQALQEHKRGAVGMARHHLLELDDFYD
jgi:hypothetical protein